MIMDVERKCSRCKVVKSITESVDSCKAKYGKGYVCKPCAREYSRLYRRGLIEPKKKSIDYQKQIQFCARCTTWKDFASFPKSKEYPSGLHCWCIECKKEYHRQAMRRWRTNNKDRLKEYYNTPEFKERRRAQSRESRARNSVGISNYHKKLYLEKKTEMYKRNSIWRANNLDRWNGYGSKRRAILRGQKHEPYSRLEIYSRDNGMCGLCKEYINQDYKFPSPKSFSIDHIIPIIAGGNDTPDNVQASHFGCNAKKAAHGYAKA